MDPIIKKIIEYGEIVEFVVIFVTFFASIYGIVGSRKKNNNRDWTLIFICFTLAMAILGLCSYFNYWYAKIPCIDKYRFDIAKGVLDDRGFDYSITNGEDFSNIEEWNYIVSLANPSEANTYACKRKTVELEIVGAAASNSSSQLGGIVPGENNDFDAPLEIRINDSQLTNQSYYEYPDPEDPNTTCYIDYGSGIRGTFSYSRTLTEDELKTWGHAGRILDSNGKEIGEEGNYPKSWATAEGLFAVEFPEGFSHGSYTYELIVVVDGNILYAQCPFVY